MHTIPACPSIYHEFRGPEPIPYDTEGALFQLSPSNTLTWCTQELIKGTDTR